MMSSKPCIAFSISVVIAMAGLMNRSTENKSTAKSEAMGERVGRKEPDRHACEMVFGSFSFPGAYVEPNC